MDPQSHADKGTPPALADAIERIMANPELISAVASALGKPTPPSEKSPEDPPPEETVATAASPELPAAALSFLPLLTGLQKGGGKLPENDRTRLLCALKPYVNPHRRETIDTLLRFSGIEELLRALRPRE